MAQIILDSMNYKEWIKFHKFVQKLEDKLRESINERKFTAPGEIINIIQNGRCVVEITRRSGKINDVMAISIPDKLKDRGDISSEKLNYAKEIYMKLKEKWESLK